MEEELLSPGGGHSNWFVKGKKENDPHRRPALSPGTSQPEILLHQSRQGLDDEAQASEVRPGERTRVGCVKIA